MMLDLLFEDYSGKPFALIGTSMGPVGGARGLEQLKMVMTALDVRLVLPTVYFRNIQTLFETDGRIKDESYAKPVKGLLDALKGNCGLKSAVS